MRNAWLAVGLFGLLTPGLGCGGNELNAGPKAVLRLIQVMTPSTNLVVGQTAQLTATGTYTDKTTQNLTASVTWSSSNTSIATVASGGVLTAQSSGTVTITASMSSVSGAVNLTIAPKLVSISISPANVTIAAQTEQQFIATGTYSDNSQQNLTGSVNWGSSQTTVATIGNSSPTQGLAQAIAKGTTAITASSGSISASATLNVTDAVATQLVISPSNFTLPLDSSHQFTATATFNDGTTQDVTNVVTWSSSPTPVATITRSGLATAKNLGTATISATFESATASTSLTVDASNLSSISIQPANGTLAQGTKAFVTATGTFTDGSTHNLTSLVAWSSSNTSVLKFISPSAGQVSALAPGFATITATFGSVTTSVPITVSNATIQSITVTPFNHTIPTGWHQTFTAIGLFSDSSTQDISASVQWSSNNSSVAAFGTPGSTNGVAMGVSPGTANINASFGYAGQTAAGTTPLTVSSATLSSVSLTPTSSLLAPGSNLLYTARGTWNDGSAQNLNVYVTWSSSNSNVATVSASGIATGQSAGTTTITAQLGSLSATSNLVVEGATLVSIQISAQNSKLPVTIQTHLKANGTFADGATLDLTSAVTWTSSSPSVATVSDAAATAGVATGVAPGTTTISAVFAGQSATIPLTVTNATLNANGITVTPANPAISLGSSEQFTAQGTFSDGSVINLSSQVAWTSTDVAVATINSAGIASSASQGTTTIQASLDGVNGTTILTVGP